MSDRPRARPAHVLILGGTADAAALAVRLAAVPGLAVTTSLAGITRWSTPIPGTVVRTGFGGAEGLARFMHERGVDRLVDATHPFAAVISRQAVDAARLAGLPLIRLERPAWQPVDGDRWIRAADTAGAAAALAAELGDRPAAVFLTIGRRGLQAFADLAAVRFVIRMVEPPDRPPPFADHTLLLDRGPFTLEGERALLAHHRIDWLVAKNSGGEAGAPKLQAAREAAVPVVMIERPAAADSAPDAAAGAPVVAPTVADVAAVLAWLGVAPLAPPAGPP